jgi:hypothetical protein
VKPEKRRRGEGEKRRNHHALRLLFSSSPPLLFSTSPPLTGLLRRPEALARRDVVSAEELRDR